MNLDSVQGTLTGMIPEQYAGYAGFLIVLVGALVLGLLAIYSYRIFRITLTLGGAIVFGVLGCFLLAPIVTGVMGEAVPKDINMPFAIGFACALIGGVLMKFLFKVALFVSGAGAGWMLGTTVIGIVKGIFPTVEFFNSQIGVYVVDAVCALILGILSLFLFKFIYIVSTSLGGMIGAVLLVVTSIKPDAGGAVMAVAMIIGLIAGIIAAVNQFKNSEGHHHEHSKN